MRTPPIATIAVMQSGQLQRSWSSLDDALPGAGGGGIELAFIASIIRSLARSIASIIPYAENVTAVITKQNNPITCWATSLSAHTNSSPNSAVTIANTTKIKPIPLPLFFFDVD